MIVKRNKSKRESFTVAIFGSARIKRNDFIYKQVKTLGRFLGERGIDLVTGGGPGLMNAANSGHNIGSRKTGALSIGFNIKLPREQKANKHLEIKKEFYRFSQRLDAFMSLSNAVIVTQGGIGTMLEFFYAWQLVQVQQICSTPIILLGDMWEGLYNWLKREPLRRKYFGKKDLNLLYFAKSHEDVMTIIDRAHESFKNGEKNFCLNYKKYKLIK